MTEIAPGLKKYVEREGAADAPRPAPGSKVHVHFTATVRSSDRAIDSSRGEFTTQVGGITVRKCNMPLQLTLPKNNSGAADAAEDADERANIRGFVLAILSMRLGERSTFLVPPELAYGSRGKGDVVGPDEALDFDVELLGVDGEYHRA